MATHSARGSLEGRPDGSVVVDAGPSHSRLALLSQPSSARRLIDRRSRMGFSSNTGPTPRHRRPSKPFRWTAIAALLILGSLAALTTVQGTRIENQRRYPHLSEEGIAAIPALADPKPSLDHHYPNSFLSKILIPRVPGSKGIEVARQHIIDVFQKQLGPDKSRGRSGWHIEEHAFTDQTPMGEKPFVNLVFTKNPAAPRKLVVSAHYDSKYFAQGNFLGATDSAAPCAMMVDLAVALDSLLESDKAKASDTTLQLLFFDGEEAFHTWTHTDSTYGSRAIAANWSATWQEPQQHQKYDPRAADIEEAPEARRLTASRGSSSRRIDSIDVLVLLDLLGARNPQIPSYFSDTHWLFEEMRSVEDRLRRAGSLYPPQPDATQEDLNRRRSFFRTGYPTYSGGIEDDHLPFLANGVPVLHAIPSPFPNVWHSLKDDASVLDYPTDYAWAMILRLFTIEYLRLEVASRPKLTHRSVGQEDSAGRRDEGKMATGWLSDHEELQ